MAGEVDWTGGDVRLTLHTSSYTVDADADATVADLTGELTAGDGYTTGGEALSGRSATYSAADSWGDQWAATTAYDAGDVVRPTAGNGFLYRAVSGGTSGAGEPTWPTSVGETVTDEGVTWECVGGGVVVLDASTTEWNPAEFTGVRVLVLSDRTEGAAADQPLIAHHTLGQDADADGLFRVLWDGQGILHIYTP